MPAKTRAKSPVQLHYKDSDNWVVVTPASEDRTVMPVEKAILACQNFSMVEEAYDQLTALLKKLGEWISKCETTIDTAYLTRRDAGLLFLVVRKDAKYDRDFEDKLTRLDIAIARNPAFNLLNVSVMALPGVSKEAQAAFLSEGLVIQYSAN